MRRSSLFAVLGMLAMAATTFAAQARPAAVWATGKIERFDANAKTIVIKQGTHEMTFALAPDAQLVQGKKALKLTDLSSEVGHSIKVRYTEHAGTKTASRVEVLAPAPVKTVKAPVRH